MQDSNNMVMTQDQELVDVLLDFVIVAASLAKKINQAILSASSSDRWLHCPPSARLCENYEDKGSDYAAEGTDAHTLCQFRLEQAFGLPTEDPIENLSWYNEEMEDCAAGYVSYVLEQVEAAKQTCKGTG